MFGGMPMAPIVLIFLDEMCCNTNQKEDSDNEKNLCLKLGSPQQQATTKDSHFTDLSFMAADGSTLMCTMEHLVSICLINPRVCAHSCFLVAMEVDWSLSFQNIYPQKSQNGLWTLVCQMVGQ
jgi:hypothetical protein